MRVASPLSGTGFVALAVNHHMKIDLSEKPQTAPCPEGIVVRPFVLERDLRPLVVAYQDAFRDHWGFVAIPSVWLSNELAKKRNARNEGLTPLPLRLAVRVFGRPFDPSAALDVAWFVAHFGVPQESRISKQPSVRDATAADEIHSLTHGLQRPFLSLLARDAAEVEEWDVQRSDRLLFERMPTFPEESDKRTHLITIGRVAEGIKRDPVRTRREAIQHRCRDHLDDSIATPVSHGPHPELATHQSWRHEHPARVRYASRKTHSNTRHTHRIEGEKGTGYFSRWIREKGATGFPGRTGRKPACPHSSSVRSGRSALRRAAVLDLPEREPIEVRHVFSHDPAVLIRCLTRIGRLRRFD